MLVGTASSSLGQGALLLSNRVPGVLDAPVFDSTGTNLLQGHYWTQLMTASTAQELTDGKGRGSLVGFAVAGGYFDQFPSGVAYISELPGTTVMCQWLVWDIGIGYSYEQVVAAGGEHGASEIFAVKVGTLQDPSPLLGLKAFQLVPASHGTIRFENMIPGLLDAPVFDTDGTPLSGAGFVAQCYARPAISQQSDAVALGVPIPFDSGAAAGSWRSGSNSTLVLTNVGSGQIAEIQIVVWEAAKGATFEEAVRALSKRGSSKLIQVKTGKEGDPESSVPILAGLESFRLGGPAPGLVLFSNLVPGQLDAPVNDIETPFVAQLYAGQSPGDLRAVGAPAPFKRRGYWEAPENGIVRLENIQAGDFAILQVRIWNGSLASSFESALLASPTGVSQSFQVRTGGIGDPPTAAAVMRGFYPYISLHYPHAVVIDFNNFIPGKINAPILGRNGSRLAGSNYVAQLYARVLNGWEPVGDPAPFGTGDQAGYWQPGGDALRLIDVPAGCCADIQVRIWDRARGSSYETATADRAISNTAAYAAINFHENLNRLGLDTFGLIWTEDFPYPTAVVKQYFGNSSWIYDLDDRELTGSNWIAQVFAELAPTNSVGVPFVEVDGSKLVPVGPIAPVRDGRWQSPPNTVIVLTGFPTNQLLVAVLRVWEKDRGPIYDEAAAHGSLLGTSSPVQFFTGMNRTDPPVEIHFGSTFSIRGHQRTVRVPPGLSFLGNPFGRGAIQWLSQVAPKAPEGTMIYLFHPEIQSYATALFDFANWTSLGGGIPFGNGFFVRNPSKETFTMVFEGVESKAEILTAQIDRPWFFAVTCTEGESCTLAERLGAPLLDGDAAYRLVNGVWEVTYYDAGTWSPFVPELKAGEGLFVRLVPRSP